MVEKRIVPPSEEYIESINYFGDKINSDILTYIFVYGSVNKVSKDKKGNYPKNGFGQISYLTLLVDSNNGRIIRDFFKVNPNNTFSIGTTVRLTDKKLNKLSKDYVKYSIKKYKKAIKKRSKLLNQKKDKS